MRQFLSLIWNPQPTSTVHRVAFIITGLVLFIVELTGALTFNSNLITDYLLWSILMVLALFASGFFPY